MVYGEEIKAPIYYSESLPRIGEIIIVPVGNEISLAKVIEILSDAPNYPVRKVITLNLWNIKMNEMYHSLKIEGIEISKLDIIKTYYNNWVNENENED